MAEWIMKEETDMDGVDCYIKMGELIRCRECKKAEHDTIFREYWCRGREVNPDGYCSDGEQKDGGDG